MDKTTFKSKSVLGLQYEGWQNSNIDRDDQLLEGGHSETENEIETITL